jgi:hypothetical protein
LVNKQRIRIDDHQTPLKKAFRGVKTPAINGDNFFSGQYRGGTGHVGMVASDNDDWTMFWRTTLGQEPPGPLPKGAKAVMVAEHNADNPVALVPVNISWDGKDTTIKWERIFLKTPENPNPQSWYAVLLIPEGGNSETYIDVPLAERQRQKKELVISEAKVFTEGSGEAVTLMPTLRLKRKAEFTGTAA